MGKRFALVGVFFLSAFVILTLLILSLLKVHFSSQKLHTTLAAKTSNGTLRYQAVHEDNGEIKTSLKPVDARIAALEKFFSDYNSPLKGHGAFIVEQADLYNIDYRLIPAIAMKESTLCKFAPKNSHNCWGYGIYGGKVKFFNSYKDGIAAVTKGLGERYVGIGLNDPHEIMQKYNPVSNGSWAETVSYVMDRITTRL